MQNCVFLSWLGPSMKVRSARTAIPTYSTPRITHACTIRPSPSLFTLQSTSCNKKYSICTYPRLLYVAHSSLCARACLIIPRSLAYFAFVFSWLNALALCFASLFLFSHIYNLKHPNKAHSHLGYHLFPFIRYT